MVNFGASIRKKIL